MKRALPRPFPRHLIHVGGFAPVYLRQFTHQPFRVTPPELTVDGRGRRLLVRHRAALFDGCLDLMLQAWHEAEATPLRPRTGVVVVALTRVAFAFDDEFEQRQSDCTEVSFDGVLEAASLAPALAMWRSVMADEPFYPQIKRFLFDHVAALHERYLEPGTGSTTGEDVDEIVRRAKLDSGGLLWLVAQVIAMYHGLQEPNAAFAGQMHDLGVAGKIADDMTDFRLDVDGNRPNLLWALTESRPEERSCAVRGLAVGRRLSARWWRRRCPRTFRAYVELLDLYASGVTSRPLRTVWAVMWLPARFGHALRQETRGRL